MCGICGFALSSRSTAAMSPAMLERMRDSLRHRGPDDAGIFFESGIGLGHRRLSIVDVASGHQPFASDDGSLQLVYNGEVYNHLELREQLVARGHRYRTRCDTESVLRMYQLRGAEAPAAFRGMFAFAIWDRNRRELFLARDRLGVKPLYYAITDDGSIVFGSEIKAILGSGLVRPNLNVGALPEYLANRATFGEHTLFAGIRRLPAGHTLAWRDGTITIQEYWDVNFEAASHGRVDEDALVDEYEQRFRKAVELRLMSDVPLGAFLSGGIDSAAITAMMSRLVDAPVKTFSVAFAEREANELTYARLVARTFRTDHYEVVASADDFFASLPQMIWHEDEPIAHPSSIALYFVSRLAAERVKVVLTGEGSDETLAGYGRYRSTVLNTRLGSLYERLGPSYLRARIKDAIEALPRHSRVRQKLGRTFLMLSTDLESIYYDNFGVFTRHAQASLLAAPTRAQCDSERPYASMARYEERMGQRTLLQQLLYSDIKTYLHELLMKQDQMSMAASIESRVPFLDHLLVEFTAQLPDNMKLRGSTTKYILRRAMRDILPPAILQRPKMGFPVPVGRWLRGSHRGLLAELLLGDRATRRGLFDPGVVRNLIEQHLKGGINHGDRLWSLMNLELWHRVFIDEEPLDRLLGHSPTLPRAANAIDTPTLIGQSVYA